MTDVTCIFGTRPELTKLVTVIEALRAAGLDTAALATGQHTDLLDRALLARVPDIQTLGVASEGSILRFLARARSALRAHLALSPPRCVLVQGDTMSAFAGAQIAHDLGIPVAHVEAGVRSHNLDDPWPEELIRVAIDKMATWKFPATRAALYNLVQEYRKGDTTHGGNILPTGNTSIDVLRQSGVAPRAEAGPTLLITLHRRELRQRKDVCDTLQALFDQLTEAPVSAIWPVHPAMHAVLSGLRFPPNLSVRPPFAHAAMLQVLAEARGLLTDSGGLVEEAAALGVPTAILRATNDRPEAVAAGIAQEFVPTPFGARNAIQALAMRTISERTPTNTFGDGHAAERIAAHLSAALARLPAVAVT